MNQRILLAEGPGFLEREGLTPQPTLWEDGLRADTGPGFLEWWYFDAHLDDGSTAVVTYATKPLMKRKGPLVPNVVLTITRPDGTKLSELTFFPAGQFQAAKERCDVRIGPNWAQGDLHRYELHAESNGLAADLILTGSVPAWRPGAGKQYYDEAFSRYFGWLVAIPFGAVEGTLAYDGQRRTVQGTCFHDHNWGNVDLNSVFSHWFWGRAHAGEYRVMFTEYVAAKAYGSQKLPIFLLAKGDRILTDARRPMTLQTADDQPHPGGKPYPRRLDVHWKDERGAVHLAIREPRIIEASSLLMVLPAWQRFLARLFVNPYYFRFVADAELTVDFAGEHFQKRGQALYDLMILR